MSETKSKYFTFYGFNNQTEKIERLIRENCSAIYISPEKVNEQINIFDEAKKFVKLHNPCIYFDRQEYKQTKYGFCTLKRSVSIINNDIRKNMTKFVFGKDIDIEKARELFEKIDKEKINNSDPEALHSKTDSTIDSKIFNIADEYLKVSREISQLNLEIEDAENVLKTCEDGEVVTSGNTRYAILIGTMPGYDIIDTEKLKNDGLYDQYAIKGNPYYKVTVDDGIKKDLNKHIKRTAENLSQEELVSLANLYENEEAILKEKQKQKTKFRDQLLKECGEGATKVKNGNKELIINIQKIDGRKEINAVFLKRDKILEKYLKKTNDLKFLSVRRLS